MAAGLIRPSWSLEQRACYGAHVSGEELLQLVSDVADEEQADPRRDFLCLDLWNLWHFFGREWSYPPVLRLCDIEMAIYREFSCAKLVIFHSYL